ncbi:uncharacterized protein EDB91DRAFT_1174112, partial [Suillus paluster]|uniref:uncharacterized protein n=1 Tax=Suillus paluster TaxID=48578 RepID=UPI001B882EFF
MAKGMEPEFDSIIQHLTAVCETNEIHENLEARVTKKEIPFLWDQGWELEDICSVLGVSQASCFRWRKIFEELGTV